MPEEEYPWLPHRDLLTFEEIARLVRIFVSIGADKVRLTGGEPLLRRDLPSLVAQIAEIPGVRDLALTTNGVLLARLAEPLFAAGLHRVTVSLDTLRRDRFQALARRDALEAVLAGIDAAVRAAAAHGRDGLKIDSVIVRGENDDELDDLLAFGRRVGAEVRFIEYMDVGGATRWSPDRVVSRAEMLDRLAARHGAVRPVVESDPLRRAAPADRYALPDGAVFGIISSTTQPFCAACDRSRLTADGQWLTCLYARAGLDLRAPLRAGASDDEIVSRVAGGWRIRTDRGAEERLAAAHRASLVPADELRRDPHLEMHTRGG